MKGYQIKITIKGSKPPIWRRVLVPERITFFQLHQTIQRAFGWQDCGRHEFEFSAAGLCIVDEAELSGQELLDWREYWSEQELIDPLVEDYPRFVYTYAFNDGCEHQLLVEKTVEYPQRFPAVIKYKGDNLSENCRGVKAFDLNQVNRSMEADLVFKPDQKRARKGSRPTPGEMYAADNPQEVYRQYSKKELKRIAKLHHLAGYSEMKKSDLIQSLAEHIQKKEVMERYFRCASEEEIQVFEQAAAVAGETYDPGEGACQYLHYGGYYGLTGEGLVVVMPTVAQAYQAISTEAFHKSRKRTYGVWAYLSAALYLYGVTTDEEIAALFNLYEKDILTVSELHGICREVQGLRCNFKYKNGYFFELALEEDGCSLVLEKRKGKRAFIPTREQVMEIARLGLSEPHRQLAPWINFISSAEDIDPLTAFEAAAIIHHMVRLGYKLRDVERVLAEAGVLLETETEQREFSELFETTRNQTRTVANYGFTAEELVY